MGKLNIKKMKYLKKFNESLEEEGFELSSHDDRNKTRNLVKSLGFTEEECEEIDIVLNSYGFKVSTMLTTLELGSHPSYYKGDMEIYIDKYEDDWYYVLYYEHQNANAVICKCDGFGGLIKALNYIGKNYG